MVSGSSFESHTSVFHLPKFLTPKNRQSLLLACNGSRAMCRRSTSRINQCEYWANLPVLHSVQLDLVDYLNRTFNDFLEPISNAYYLFDKGGLHGLRMGPNEHHLSVYIILSSTSKQPWLFRCSSAVSEEARQSRDFPAGVITDRIISSSILDQAVFTAIELRESDAVLFQGGKCFHLFDGASPGTTHLVAFHFKSQNVFYASTR